MSVSPSARTLIHLAVSGTLLCAAMALGWHMHTESIGAALLRAAPDQAVTDRNLVNFAMARAPALYERHCAGCHGRDMRGKLHGGAPDLADAVWLYGLGDLPDIENTLDYGIRSGHPKSHNITDMPGLGRIGQLSAAETQDVVEYVYGLSHPGVTAEVTHRGRAVFMDKGSCYDCHAPDASGNVDYGAPDLTGHSGWLYGGDRHTLYQSVYDGRHGLCPAWSTRLDAMQIRELAVFLYITAHHATRPHTGAGAS